MIWQPVRNRVQSELIKRGHCAACTRSLATAERKESNLQKHCRIVTCLCRRVYIYDTRINSYRRALIEELKSH